MKIKIGEYIRTKKGLIAKIYAYQELKIYDDKGENARFYSFDTDKGTVADIEIAKHSKNIIDLIEVEDYINLEHVLDITGEYIRTAKIIHNKCWLSNNIESIVTKEQFKNAEYRIPEEK